MRALIRNTPHNKTLLITLVKMLLVGLVCFELSLNAKADEMATDKIYLEEAVISGNQELPKVLYILPWQEVSNDIVPERRIRTQTQSVLTPIYPAEFKRALNFRKRLRDSNTQQLSN